MSRRENTSIRNAEEFSIAFATAVTEVSDNPQDWIAKKGTDSIFAVLDEIFPQASRYSIYVSDMSQTLES
jgi:hypothetical protein